jgi:hypothetical protein
MVDDSYTVVSRPIIVTLPNLTVLSKLFRLVTDGRRKLLGLPAVDALRVVLRDLRPFVTRSTSLVVALVLHVQLVRALVGPSTKQLLLFAPSALVRVILRLWQPVRQIEEVLWHSDRAQ